MLTKYAVNIQGMKYKKYIRHYAGILMILYQHTAAVQDNSTPSRTA